MMGILGERLVKLFLAVAILLFLLTDAARGGSRGGSIIGTAISGSIETGIDGQTLITAVVPEPDSCHNIYDKDDNQTIYAYFICPLPNDPHDYIYCCGHDDREHCCTFFDDAGRLAGVVIGILAVCILLVIGGVYLFTICRGDVIWKL